jgi:hypothetical protein
MLIGKVLKTQVIIKPADRALLRATMEPTERSMPAVNMVKVMPMAVMATMEVWKATLRKLEGVSKWSESSDKSTHRPMKIRRTLKRRKTSTTLSALFALLGNVLP